MQLMKVPMALFPLLGPTPLAFLFCLESFLCLRTRWWNLQAGNQTSSMLLPFFLSLHRLGLKLVLQLGVKQVLY